MVYHNDQWLHAEQMKEEIYEFEWSLIKTDEFGNPIALKIIGKGPELKLEIPENYENYRLLLTAIPEGSEFATQHFTQLNTAYK